MQSSVRSIDSHQAELLSNYELASGKAPSSEVILRASMLAPCTWGLENKIDFVRSGQFPDSNRTDALEHWAGIYGLLPRRTNETDAELLTRLLRRLRRPPAGGNKYDWERWAIECGIASDGSFVSPENLSQSANYDVARATCYPLARGVGTVDLVISMSRKVRILEMVGSGYVGPQAADVGKVVTGDVSGDSGLLVSFNNTSRLWWVRCLSESDFSIADTCSISGSSAHGDMNVVSYSDVPYAKLLLAVTNYIDDVRPVTQHQRVIKGVSRLVTPVAVTVSGNEFNSVNAQAAILKHMNELAPGAKFFRSKIVALCVDAGAETANVTAPANDIVPESDEIVRPSYITTTEV
jgi:hypothetical protein